MVSGSVIFHREQPRCRAYPTVDHDQSHRTYSSVEYPQQVWLTLSRYFNIWIIDFDKYHHSSEKYQYSEVYLKDISNFDMVDRIYHSCSIIISHRYGKCLKPQNLMMNFSSLSGTVFIVFGASHFFERNVIHWEGYKNKHVKVWSYGQPLCVSDFHHDIKWVKHIHHTPIWLWDFLIH